MSPRTVRITTFVVQPSLLAAVVALHGHSDHLHAAASVLVALWVMMAGALAMRVVEAHRRARTPEGQGAGSPWDHLDVLTATGGSLLWLGTIALLASGLSGWASLSVVGVLGLGTVYLTGIWTTLVAGGVEPWRRAVVARTILPEVAVEGDPMREEVRLTDVWIPIGMRLFATGRATRHGAITRYVVSSDASRADVKLESDLGPAQRGDHRAPPLALWLGDVLGLTRTPVMHRGDAKFSVLPRPSVVNGVQNLVGNGGDAATSRPTHRLPTEGTFRMREYVPGDDARRIHWVRSLQTNQLIVRLPDEIPPAEPAVRLILDNDLWHTEGLTTRAPDELLDVMVRLWLGIGKALAESGTRVTLVTAAPKGDGTVVTIERPMLARSRDALRLGARVAWQPVPLSRLLAPNVRQVVVSCRPRRIDTTTEITWVVVPEVAWTTPEPSLLTSRSVSLAYPMGSAENRLSRRRRERQRIHVMWQDRATFSQMMCGIDWAAFAGGFVARPNPGRITLQPRITVGVKP